MLALFSKHVMLLSIAFLLIFLNAFFVASEFSLVKLRETRIGIIRKRYGWRGQLLEKMHQHLDLYLSACQVGITLASIGLGWVGEPTFAVLIQWCLESYALSAWLIHFLAFSFAFLVITFLHIVLGEMVPKTLAIRQAEKTALLCAVPLYAFRRLFSPLILVMNGAANGCVRLFSRKPFQSDVDYSTEEIKMVLDRGFRSQILSKEETSILEHALELKELTVGDVMRPCDEMVGIESHASLEQVLEKIKEQRYSRYPIYDGAANRVIGILHIKDLFLALQKKESLVDWSILVRPVLTISRKISVLSLLGRFQSGVSHFALVYKTKKNRIIGFVTLDNVLHILLGKIQDEFHLTRDDWDKIEEGVFLMKGHTSIYTLERALDIDLEEAIDSLDVDTISGLILNELGAYPKLHERIHFNQFDLVVEGVRDARITQVRVIKNQQASM